VLADTLNNEALDLGRPRQRGGLLLEAVEELVWERLAELERAAQEAVERGDVARGPATARSLGERRRHGRSVLSKGGAHVLLREGGQENGVAEGPEPDAERTLGACETEPFAAARQLLVKAVIYGGLL